MSKTKNISVICKTNKGYELFLSKGRKYKALTNKQMELDNEIVILNEISEKNKKDNEGKTYPRDFFEITN